MNDFFLILLALLAVVFFLLGPIGFFLTLGARARLARAEQQIQTQQKAMLSMEAAMAELRRRDASIAPAPAPEPIESSHGIISRPVIEPAPAGPVNIAEDAAAPEPLETRPREPAAAAKPPELIDAAPPPPRSLEETIGTRWAVWVGGLALGLGALLLVRYSIEQGWFGPEARIFLGLAFSAALIAGGEWLRRRDPFRRVPADPAAGAKPSQIPAILTAAGTVGAFGAIYAAHALYGFIGPALAFIALGLIGAAAMLAAALHGPALAGLGLLGALAVPLLVQSNAPNPWPVVLYLALVIGFAYALARLRLWLWLALSAAAGGLLWGIGLDFGHGTIFYQAALAHAVIQTLMATALFAIISSAGVSDAEARIDPLALIVPSAYAALALGLLWIGSSNPFSSLWDAAACAAIIATLTLGGILAAPAAGLVSSAGIFLAASLAIWPFFSSFATFPTSEFLKTMPAPRFGSWFAGYAAMESVVLALMPGRRLAGGRDFLWPIATIYAGSAALIPLGVLAITYVRLTRSDFDLPFAAIAGGLALVFLIAANWFFSRDKAETHANLRLGLGAFASGALAALSLGLAFSLDRGMLTVALALSALGSALVDRRLGIGALRWCTAGLGLIIAARLLYEPRIAGADLGTTPIFNWLLWGYGVPAAAFGIAAQLLRRRGQDTPVLIAQALSIVFFALLGFFEIRHAINGGDPFARSSGLIEQGLFATMAFGFSLVLTRLDVTQSSAVLRLASFGFGILSFTISLTGLLIYENPLLSGEPLEGGTLLNALLLAYALPALLALGLSRAARGSRPRWYWCGAQIAALALCFAYANLELRRLFQGPVVTAMDWGNQIRHDIQITSDAEIYSYSVLWLVLSIICLAFGLWRGSAIARLVSALLMLMTILKVFLYDLAGLTGALRALSFIGLGLVLIGIGLVYQKFVFARRAPPRV